MFCVEKRGKITEKGGKQTQHIVMEREAEDKETQPRRPEIQISLYELKYFGDSILF